MSFEWVRTADGSFSCHDSETDQLCHNSAGAFTEALQNYAIPSGLVELARQQRDIRVLDACYGLGYNTWVLVQHLLQTVTTPFTVSVVGIEASAEILEFSPRIFEHPTLADLKNEIGTWEHNIDYRTQECSFDTKRGPQRVQNVVINVAGNRTIHFELYLSDLRQQVLDVQGDFDRVFHDPFSPQKMPELWTVDLFQEYARLLRKRQGSVLTYSMAAAVRGGLLEAGFSLGKTQALGKKAGGTIACLASTHPEPQPSALREGPSAGISLTPMDSWELAYLETRAGIPYRDTDLRQTREAILARRLQEQSASARPSGSALLKQKNRAPLKGQQ